ncbi:MAG: twin-arginine translocation signal domain-containing protein [Bryobacteraceae bacterium]
MSADKNKNRRSFLRGSLATGAATVGAGILGSGLSAFGEGKEEGSGRLDKGDAAILRFLAAAEIIETDLWVQYNELGGIQDREEPDGSGNPLYTDALTILDGDMAQYIHDNTDDEFTHWHFINAYLASKGADKVDLDRFRTLNGSIAEGSSGKGRLTNLTQLSVDTSFWTRYRSSKHNPDLDPGFTFAQAVKGLNVGQHPAIPRSDADTAGSSIGNPTDHLKAIAFTAGFHFAFIEQGGTSIYPSLAQRVTSPEVLRILLSIGPTETMHFQTWQDKAGNATPLTDTDPITKATVTFVDLTTNQPESLQANLIMPEPCPFLSRKFPPCSIIRPTETKGAAMGVVKAFAADGLFIGQSKEFFELLRDLAEDADEARREP